jgi:hypothetical protein
MLVGGSRRVSIQYGLLKREIGRMSACVDIDA